MATFVERKQEPQANWLIVDAGNFVDRAGSPEEVRVHAAETLKYDVLNVARQEISMGTMH
ncbi:MAG: hypothetical protein IPK53_20530 [bacterium]|nr:hypothetical protein [bacterium]